jgi:hypothetical protein
MFNYSDIITSDSIYTDQGLAFFLGISPSTLLIARRSKLLRCQWDHWGYVYRGNHVKVWLRAVDEVVAESPMIVRRARTRAAGTRD